MASTPFVDDIARGKERFPDVARDPHGDVPLRRSPARTGPNRPGRILLEDVHALRLTPKSRRGDAS
jgi:hypothetical protein